MTSTTTTDLSWRFALRVVVAAMVTAAIVRWSITALTRSGNTDVVLLGSAFALVIGYMVAVAGVGLGMRNRQRGGPFTLIFALLLAAEHVFSGVTQGMSILVVPFDPTSTDFTAFLLVPLLYTVPAAILQLVRWRWVAIALAAGIAASNAVFALSGGWR
jgi:hypothetical protein